MPSFDIFSFNVDLVKCLLSFSSLFCPLLIVGLCKITKNYAGSESVSR